MVGSDIVSSVIAGVTGGGFWEEGRPIKYNRETVCESLQRLVKDVRGMHIDHMGSLKDWYLDAPDDIFWNKSVEHLRDHRNPVPERPNRDTGFNPRRSYWNHSSPPEQEQKRDRESWQQGDNISPPRRNRERSQPRDNSTPKIMTQKM